MDLDKTSRMDSTTVIDGSPSRPTGSPRVITLPPKERVNIALAAIAGALLILVLVAAHDTLSRAASPTSVPSAPAMTSVPATATPAAPAPAKGKGKGDGD